MPVHCCGISDSRIGIILYFAIIIFVIARFELLAFSQSNTNMTCELDAAMDGDEVKIHGLLFNTASPMFIRPNACPDHMVVVIYGDDPSLGNARISIKRDEQFQQFDKQGDERWPDTEDFVCLGCAKYKITADFEGRLQIAPGARHIRDPKSGKILRVEGFGSATFLTRYRLILSGVSNVEAVERPVIR
jgi:hypothetical protein